MRELTLDELRERRRQRFERRLPALKKKKPLKRARVKKGRGTIVSSCSLPPELKYRAQRELGNGSFSLAVVRALTQALLEIDRASGKPNSRR